MTRRRRTIILAALALAVPLPALALTGGAGSSLSVSASLKGCGVSGGGIMCGISASWSGVEGARYYTVSVTAPDGSVTDLGNVGGGGGTIVWVPYSGDGTYTVSVSAYGVSDMGDAKVLDSDEATSEAHRRSGGGEAHLIEGAAAEEPSGEAEQPAEETPPVEDAPAEPAPAPEPPPCPPEPEPEPAPEAADGEPQPDEAAAPELAPEEDTPPADCVPAG